MNPCGSSSAPLHSSAALILFWWPHHENRDALSTLLYACYSLHLSPPHEQTAHTPTGWETGDAYPSADPTGNADTGLPICYCSLRQDGRKAGKEGGGEERRGKENRGTEKEGGSILTTQRSARMLVVGPTATVFLIDDLCWIDTFCWGPKHAASPQRLAFVNQ